MSKINISMAQSKTTALCIKGMHCPSCDILIKSKFKEISNIKEVKPNYQTQQAEIMYTGELNKSLLNKKILQFGYQVVDTIPEAVEPLSKRLTDASIFAIGLSYILNTSSIYGFNLSMFSPNAIQAQANDPNVKMENGYQVVKMNVNAKGYEPSNITVKQGIPVKWIINGENVFGCQGSLIAPKAGIQAVLKTGENIYEFTPKDKDPLAFSCSMGMVRGQFNVI